MGAQFISSSQRRYRLSIAVWWCFLVRLWVKLFVSQGLIQAFFGLSDGHKRFPASIEKHQLRPKAFVFVTFWSNLSYSLCLWHRESAVTALSTIIFFKRFRRHHVFLVYIYSAIALSYPPIVIDDSS